MLEFHYVSNGKVGNISNTYLIHDKSFFIKTIIEKEMNQKKCIDVELLLSELDLNFILTKILSFINNSNNKRALEDEQYFYSIGKIIIDGVEYIYYDSEDFLNMIFSISKHLKENYPEIYDDYLERYNDATQKIYKEKIKVFELFDKKKK